MRYLELREELRTFYWTQVNDRAKAFCEACERELDAAWHEELSSYDMKVMQYKLITERFDPVLFEESPFYYELGTMAAHCDGAGELRGHMHVGGWTYRKNQHRFIDQDPALWDLRNAQRKGEQFYLICGPYNDTRQHFCFDYRPVFAEGLKSRYEAAQAELKSATDGEERAFLSALCEGLLCVRKIGEKFAQKAKDLLATATDEKSRANLKRIADTAARVPWEKPTTFFEALNTYAFLRKAVGALEGVGVNTFGRVDVDLYPFYQKDLAEGRLTPEEAYDLICQFLITFDLHYDHDMKMVAYADHELENTYVLGGCDAEGKPLYNELTEMFLRATSEEKVIFPKITCRFDAHSPKAYLDRINAAVVAGTSTVLYQNDDATIPALVRAGYTLSEARDYVITGCWGLNCYGVEKRDGGAYVNMLKPFEFSIHRLDERMKKVGMYFAPIDGARDFEEVYRITCENIRTLFAERIRITSLGGHVWNRVDPLPIYSSTLSDCIAKRRDYTNGGARYQNDGYDCFGFPNLVDSLLAIRELCFEQKKYTLEELLNAVRSNWVGFERMQLDAKRCHGWGDGSEASCSFAKRFHDDLFAMTESLTGSHGGKVLLGHLTYTEIRWWGEKTLALPDGRGNGEYFAQGLTPSRLKHIPSVTDVVNSFSCLDASQMGQNSVVNVILPFDKNSIDLCEGFLRVVADSAIQSLQLNCTTKEQLLDAQKHPESYPDLIVRVTGFSAKFTSLSPEWQQEVLTRNFYE